MSLKVCETFKWQYLVDMKSIVDLELKGEQDWTSDFENHQDICGSKSHGEESWGWNSEGHQYLPEEGGLETARGSENQPFKKQKVIAQKIRENSFKKEEVGLPWWHSG